MTLLAAVPVKVNTPTPRLALAERTLRAPGAAPPMVLPLVRIWMPSSPLASASVPVMSVPMKLPETVLAPAPASTITPDQAKRLIASPVMVLPAAPLERTRPRLLSAPVLVSSMRKIALSPLASVLAAAPAWV